MVKIDLFSWGINIIGQVRRIGGIMAKWRKRVPKVFHRFKSYKERELLGTINVRNNQSTSVSEAGKKSVRTRVYRQQEEPCLIQEGTYTYPNGTNRDTRQKNLVLIVEIKS